jgi:PncC family amidohydrolase
MDWIHNGNEAAARVGALLLQRGWTLSGAESCTGGLVGHYLTNIAGSSAYFMGGVLAYANQAKQELLGVCEEALRTVGAVSAEVALAMARGARQRLHTDVAYAVTGIAGPGGGTPTKPVGTVYTAVVTPLGEWVEHHLWQEDRETNKQLSALAVLDLIEHRLREPEA